MPKDCQNNIKNFQGLSFWRNPIFGLLRVQIWLKLGLYFLLGLSYVLSLTVLILQFFWQFQLPQKKNGCFLVGLCKSWGVVLKLGLG